MPQQLHQNQQQPKNWPHNHQPVAHAKDGPGTPSPPASNPSVPATKRIDVNNTNSVRNKLKKTMMKQNPPAPDSISASSPPCPQSRNVL
jgi:hypothetical protein